MQARGSSIFVWSVEWLASRKGVVSNTSNQFFAARYSHCGHLASTGMQNGQRQCVSGALGWMHAEVPFIPISIL